MDREHHASMLRFVAQGKARFLLGVSIVLGLYLTSLYSYLLFHSLAEIFSIVVACSIFMVFWNSRRLLSSGYFLFIGIAYLFVGGMDLLHTLSYTGMGVFPGYGTNLPTQLWITARYLESLSFLIAVFFLRHKLKTIFVILGYTLTVSVLLISIFYWKIFPDCFVEGPGLTPFKKISEYCISLILLVSIGLLVRKRREFDNHIYRLLVSSIVLTIASELAFTFYVHAYGLPNLIGHFLKIVSFYLIYKALIEVGLSQPYHLMFRDLKRSEEKYRDLVENTSDVIYALDTAGVLTYVSPAVESFIGYSSFEVQGHNIKEFIHDEDVPIITEGLRTVFSGQSAANEYRVLSKSGEVRWMRTSSKPVFVKNRVVGLSGVLTDITERKLAEEALRESERELAIRNRIASVFLTIPDEEMYGNVLEVIVEAMESTYGVFGYIDEYGSLIIPSMTRDIWDQCQVLEKTIVFPRDKWGGIWGRALTQKRSLYANEGLNVPQGHVPIAKVLVVPIVYDKEIIGLLEVANRARDYGEKDKEFLEGIAGYMAPVLSARLQRDRQEGERQHVEESLRKSEERLKHFVESATDSILLLDSHLNIVEVNEIGLNEFGLSKNEILGKNLSELVPDLRESGRYDKYMEVMKTGEPFIRDDLIHHPEFGEKHVTVKVFQVGSGLGIIAMDITQRKLLEEKLTKMAHDLEKEVEKRTKELLKTQHHLTQSQKLAGLGQLAAGVSHELRNPLGIINASLYFLKSTFTIENSAFHKHIKIMEEEVERSSKIVENLLEFARRSPYDVQAIDVNELLEKTLILLEKELLANDVRVSTVFEPLPQVSLHLDEMKQVFLNILLNATQAMPEGGDLKINTHVVQGDEGDGYVSIVFQDTGIGISEEDLTNIFNPFFTTKEGGVGLGLSLVYATVKRFGGKIHIDSHRGEGTKVTLKLPLIQGSFFSKT
ncbi:MAG: PAS domain S-box protein [Gemmatimonadota bacterium]|nr:MAG: PAS domain S-box protein [Gemmatimonadota bacterium]